MCGLSLWSPEYDNRTVLSLTQVTQAIYERGTS